MIFKKSIIHRYLVWSVLASTLPVLAIGLLYDRFASSALEQMLGEKISSHLTATTNRLGAYLDARSYQVETLANYPGIAAFVNQGDADPSTQIDALLQIESDLPDLYGILFFDPAGKLLRVVPGQAASGPPYWPDRPFEVSRLPITSLGETEVIGPMPPENGDSGWLLVRHPIRGLQQARPLGYIALHVRLASLTEQLGATGSSAALQPLLRTPVGDFNTVAQPVRVHGRLIFGPDVLTGWQPLLEVESTGVMQSFDLERRALLFAVLVGAAVVIYLFFRLSRHLRKRVSVLLQGTKAISDGKLGHRIDDEGDDEIASVSHAFNAMSATLQDYMERAVRIEKLAVLGEFATGVAHEIRNPLAAIKTSVQALARREQEPRRLRLLADMDGEIDRLAGVVSDLVDFGRPRPPKRDFTPVREVFQRIVTMVETEAARRGIQISWQGDTELALYVDRDQLLQIILNLTLNALHATPAGGAVVLRASQQEGLVALEVSDTGCGIAAELLDRVSDPFFTTKTKGVGLGLSISRQLCDMNGGRISIDSVPGQGTVVRIVFPGEADQHADDPDY